MHHTHLHDAVRADQHVLGLHVAVDDAVRVEVVERLHELLGDVPHLRLGQLLVVLQDLEQLPVRVPGGGQEEEQEEEEEEQEEEEDGGGGEATLLRKRDVRAWSIYYTPHTTNAALNSRAYRAFRTTPTLYCSMVVVFFSRFALSSARTR